MSASGRDKKIGLISVLSFAVGAMIGGGVFTLSGEALDRAGPAALVSYAIAGVVMLLSALSSVAIATRAQPGESGFAPITGLLGRPWRFLVMWGFYLNALLGVAFLADSFGVYLHNYFLTSVGATVAGVLCIALLGALNLGPATWVGRAETWTVAVKIGLLLIFVGWGLAALSVRHIKSFAPHGAGPVLSTSALLFTAYTGFNVVTNILPSVRNPIKTVPRAIIGAMLISIAMYLLVGAAMVASGITHFGVAGVSEAAQALMGSWGGKMIAFAACLSTLSGANAMLLGGSEIALRLVADEDIPAMLGKTTKAGFPWMSVGLIAIVALMLVLFTNIISVIVLGNITALVAMLVVNLAAVALARRGFPGAGFRIPGGPLLPVIAALACLSQFVAYDPADLLAAGGALALGLVAYHQRGRGRHLFPDEALDSIREAIYQHETPLARALTHPLHRHPFRRQRPLIPRTDRSS
jgi:amino acid transporter